MVCFERQSCSAILETSRQIRGKERERERERKGERSVETHGAKTEWRVGSMHLKRRGASSIITPFLLP